MRTPETFALLDKVESEVTSLGSDPPWNRRGFKHLDQSRVKAGSASGPFPEVSMANARIREHFLRVSPSCQNCPVRDLVVLFRFVTDLNTAPSRSPSPHYP